MVWTTARVLVVICNLQVQRVLAVSFPRGRHAEKRRLKPHAVRARAPPLVNASLNPARAYASLRRAFANNSHDALSQTGNDSSSIASPLPLDQSSRRKNTSTAKHWATLERTDELTYDPEEDGKYDSLSTLKNASQDTFNKEGHTNLSVEVAPSNESNESNKSVAERATPSDVLHWLLPSQADEKGLRRARAKPPWKSLVRSEKKHSSNHMDKPKHLHAILRPASPIRKKQLLRNVHMHGDVEISADAKGLVRSEKKHKKMLYASSSSSAGKVAMWQSQLPAGDADAAFAVGSLGQMEIVSPTSANIEGAQLVVKSQAAITEAQAPVLLTTLFPQTTAPVQQAAATALPPVAATALPPVAATAPPPPAAPAPAETTAPAESSSNGLIWICAAFAVIMIVVLAMILQTLRRRRQQNEAANGTSWRSRASSRASVYSDRGSVQSGLSDGGANRSSPAVGTYRDRYKKFSVRGELGLNEAAAPHDASQERATGRKSYR